MMRLLLALLVIAAVVIYVKSSPTSGETEPTREYCLSLEDQGVKDWCTCALAVRHKDPSLCEGIKSPDWKGTCLKKAGP
jgi:hypothetical protein